MSASPGHSDKNSDTDGGSVPSPDASLPSNALVVNGQMIAPASALQFSFVASAGPGGQNVNKRATKCVLRVAMRSLTLRGDQLDRLARLANMYLTVDGELVIDADDNRSQSRNRDACVERLEDMIRQAWNAPKPRKKTKPSKGSVRRRLEGKKVRGEAKERRKRVDD